MAKGQPLFPRKVASKCHIRGNKADAIPVASCVGWGDTRQHCDSHDVTAPGLSSSYPFNSFQISFQQTVQRERDDVVHILNLKKERKQKRYSTSFSIQSKDSKGVGRDADNNSLSRKTWPAWRGGLTHPRTANKRPRSVCFHNKNRSLRPGSGDACL